MAKRQKMSKSKMDTDQRRAKPTTASSQREWLWLQAKEGFEYGYRLCRWHYRRFLRRYFGYTLFDFPIEPYAWNAWTPADFSWRPPRKRAETGRAA
jgi:hypothetical protein